ncbi:PAS domain S-box protein [Iodobacter sp. LRB]|uniref:PAS domain-containing sensor histidine kinase n=1 Tax=unclassified Iodobacter TaxID=235634 RepID=UPI000C124245|nr:PAS domain S-box protein [Iodobacter sp. BJB302]
MTLHPITLSPRLGRWLQLLPGLIAALFTLAFASWLLLTTDADQKQRNNQLEQDLLWQKQAIQQQITANTDAINALAVTDYNKQSALFQARAFSLIQNSPEIVSLVVRNQDDFKVWWSAPQQKVRAFNGESGWSTLPAKHDQPPLAQYAVSSADGHNFIIATFSFDRLLQQQVPWWIAQRYQVLLLNHNYVTLAAKSSRQLDPSGLSTRIALDTPPLGLSIQAELYHVPRHRLTESLPWVLLFLAIGMLASTALLHRVMRVRSQAEMQLRAETALRQAMEDSLVSGMRAMDKDGRLIYVNRAFCEMTGFSADELLGQQPPLPYWPPEELERCQAAFDAIRLGRADPNGQAVRFMRKNGERFDVSLHGSSLIDGAGRHIGWMGSLYDITELKREREVLQASHQRFVTVLDGLDTAVAVSDADSGELLMSNRQFDRSFNLPDWRGRCCIVPFSARRFDTPVDSEWYDPIKKRWFQIKSRHSLWVDDSDVWLEVATDITALKSAAERERMQNEKLQQTSRLISMGEMASSLAHELNQPLGAIASYASGCRNILANPQPNLQQLSQAIEKMGEQARRAGQIIRGIREFVQRRAPHRRRCTITGLLDTVLDLQSHEAVRRGVEISISESGDLPPLYVDPIMLEQVLFNLIRNAMEAMNDTPASQRTLAIMLSREHDYLQVIIADRGTGISSEQMEQLFKPFYTTKDTGMGMGLNICRSIIEYHQGRLWAENNPGGGCRFIFTVPFSEETQANEP